MLPPSVIQQPFRSARRGARAERFTCRPSARITRRRTPPACRATRARAAVRLRAERHATCSARAGEPRSILERACFTTCPDATLTCAAREVTLYLALTFSRLLAPSPASPMTDCSSIGSGSVTVPPGGPSLGPRPARCLASARPSGPNSGGLTGGPAWGASPCVMAIVPEAFRCKVGGWRTEYRSLRAADAFP